MFSFVVMFFWGFFNKIKLPILKNTFCLGRTLLVNKFKYIKLFTADVAVESLPVSEALSRIRFLLMTAEEFTGGPALSPLLTSEEKLAIAMNITRPGVIKLPERINTMTTPRHEVEGVEQTVPPLEWSLVREVSDTIFYPITRWVNPFPRKGFTVSRNIKLSGVKVSTFWRVSTAISSLTLSSLNCSTDFNKYCAKKCM